jgi:hypothetical protein
VLIRTSAVLPVHASDTRNRHAPVLIEVVSVFLFEETNSHRFKIIVPIDFLVMFNHPYLIKYFNYHIFCYDLF